MRAVQIHQHGGPEVLEPVVLPDPRPGPDEVLVRNEFIGVNYVDLQHRAGHPCPVGLPLVPGTEAAGTVVEVGADVDRALVGCPVVHFGHLAGVYAELSAVPQRFVVPLAPGARLDHAAALAMAGTTAHVLTRLAVQIRPDDRVVVHAAAGSTGGALVQLSVAAGARVVALASTQERAEQALALGATVALAFDGTPEAVAAVRDATGGGGATHVFDANGGPTFDASLDMLAPRGTLVLYGQSGGPVGPFPPGRLSGITQEGGAGSLGLRWVAASHYLETAEDRAVALRAVMGAVRDGVLPPRIARRLPLDAADEAHRLLAGRAVGGKVLLVP
jgi:NADPH2:quinone reductase